jgi:predicted secreted protein
MATHPATQPRPVFGRQHLLRWMIVIGVLVVAALAVVAVLSLTQDGDVTPAAVSVSDADNGRAIAVALDGSVIVRLESNATTGYSWAVDSIDDQVLTVESDTYVAPTNGMVGQGGTQEMTFRAVGPGERDVSLKYWRPWEGDASVIERFVVTVTVTER